MSEASRRTPDPATLGDMAEDTGRATSIADAGPTAAPTTATVSAREQRAYLRDREHPAARAFREAATEAEDHARAFGAHGPAYAAKVKAWRQRYTEWRLAVQAQEKA